MALNAHPFGPASFPAALDAFSVKSMWRIYVAQEIGALWPTATIQFVPCCRTE
jgi:hypothetical protein